MPSKKRYQANKEHCKQQNREWKARNKPKVLAEAKKYREKVGSKALTERQRQWRIDHPEEYAAIHAKWKKANKDKVNTSTHKRRSIKRGQLLHHTTSEWQDLKVLRCFECVRCLRSEPAITLCRDHIVPLCKGGSDTIDNIQPLCRSCNSTKARDIVRF